VFLQSTCRKFSRFPTLPFFARRATVIISRGG
jgi:hypothetical protein